MGIEDKTIIRKFIEAEQERPSARKELEEYTIYASRAFDSPSGKSIGAPLLSDLGSTTPEMLRTTSMCSRMSIGRQKST